MVGGEREERADVFLGLQADFIIGGARACVAHWPAVASTPLAGSTIRVFSITKHTGIKPHFLLQCSFAPEGKQKVLNCG